MQDSTRRSVAPRFGVNGPCSNNGRAELSAKFRFAVTWAGVTSHLRLIETAGLSTERNRASGAAAAVAVVPDVSQVQQVPQQVPAEAKARWEMVVPKMDRARRIPQVGSDYPAASLPAMSPIFTPPPAPLLTRAMAMLGMRGRGSDLEALQLNPPSPARPTVNEGREQLLSKITKSLRSRAQEPVL